MSEELKQKGLLKNGIKIGNTNFSELVKAKIIPNKDYGNYNIKRPDDLIVDRTNKKSPKVIAVVEYKKEKNK